MKALIYYHHGLGDCILLTPQLKYLSEKFKAEITLLCRKSVISSKIFVNCPFVNNVVPIANPWESDFKEQLKINYQIFEEMRENYDIAFFIDHLSLNKAWNKVFSNSLYCRIFDSIDVQPEIFISPFAKKIAEKYIRDHFPRGFIFKHTLIPLHPVHSWPADDWIIKNLPDLPVFDMADIDTCAGIFSDINVTFYILSKADYVVVSSSVMAHAADAIKKPIDVLNYGKPDYYNLPVNRNIVRRLRVNGAFIDVDYAYSKLQLPKRIRFYNLLSYTARKNGNFLKRVSFSKLRKGLL